MKKILLGLGAIAAVLVVMPMFAAFEAHVVNVTATIENALSVPIEEIKFGTVFPQEHLNKPLDISLSSSFMTENRVDDVEYFIRQKPKCAWSWQVGTVWSIDETSTATGHVIPKFDDPQTTDVDESVGGTAYTVDCGSPVKPDGIPANATWGQLPSLCPYISKHPDTDVLNDEGLNSFHQPFSVANSVVSWTDADGRLAKSENDTVDNWTIDLAVPCFGGQCAQDWLSFVRRISGNAEMTQQEADQYTQPTENEHKVFGCDLWVEVSGVSNAPVTTSTEQ